MNFEGKSIIVICLIVFLFIVLLVSVPISCILYLLRDFFDPVIITLERIYKPIFRRIKMKKVTPIVDGNEAEVILKEKDIFRLIQKHYKTKKLFSLKSVIRTLKTINLFVKLKIFANKNNCTDFNIHCDCKKYYIGFDVFTKHIRIIKVYNSLGVFQIYFDSEETVNKAIDKFHDELIRYFTECGND